MSRQKRFLILFLSLITMMGLLTGCGILPTTIVSEVDPSVYQYQSNVRHIQDLGAFFARQRAAYRAVETQDNGYQKVTIDNETDQWIVLEYVELLLSDAYGFQICGEFDRSLDDPFGGNFSGKWSIAFESTLIDAGKELKSTYNTVPCDLYITHSGDELSLFYSDVFSVKDAGYRYSGAPTDTLLDFTGRALQPFVKQFGSYYTGDAEFSVKANVREPYEYYRNSKGYQAYKGSSSVIYNSGEAFTGTASITVGQEKDSDAYSVDAATIEIENFLDNATGEQIHLVLPVANESGVIYRFSDFLTNHQGYKEKSCYGFYYTPSEMEYSIQRSFKRDVVSHIESLTVRIIQWDISGEEDCVVYLHSLMYLDGEPIEIECLVAARLNSLDNMEEVQEEVKSSSSSSKSGWSIFDDDDDGPYIPDAAKLDCLTCGGDGDCNTCNGYGEWRRYNSVVSTCNTCNGSGNCRTCGGSGKR